ncbi:MAG: DUF4382 domain-containing protein [Candidatus Eisenbacteria bacterium]|nr:DUF4382 domain-containing protein [Candidatus Eisenbacteria bacterium]
MSLRRNAIVVALACALAAGCSGGPPEPSAPIAVGTGTAQLQVTDAPAAVEAVNLVVLQVAIRHAGAADTLSGWEILRTDSLTIELLSLRGGALADLALGTVPAGSYDQVRLKLGTRSSVQVDGATFPLTVPSGSESGLKIMGGFDVPTNGTVRIVLDFNAERSIHRTGSDKYIMQPVVRLIDVAGAGAIAGRLAPADIPVTLHAVLAGDTLRSVTTTAGQAAFSLPLLPAGSYTLLVRPAANFRDTSFAGLTVSAGGTTDIGTLALAPR